MALPPAKTHFILPDGRQGEGVEVPLESANERWSEFVLQDGTIFRAKINLIQVVRVEGEYDSQGIPLYQVNAQPALAFMHVPENLKKKPQ
jgi:hypothetical protein